MNVCLYLKPEIAIFVVVSILARFQRDLKLSEIWTKAISNTSFPLTHVLRTRKICEKNGF